MTAFADLHVPGKPLVLPNAWDFASAAALVDAGFGVLGTTSLGVAAAAGVPDGKGETREQTLALAARLVRLPCQLTVDIETGFGAPGEVAAALAGLGVVGVNLEDGRPDAPLAPIDEQCGLIAEVRSEEHTSE